MRYCGLSRLSGGDMGQGFEKRFVKMGRDQHIYLPSLGILPQGVY